MVSEVLRKALKEVPDYTTICKAVKRLREEGLRKLLEESSKLLGVKLEILAIDSTGLRDNASFYYAKRSGKKRKNWRKLTIVVDTDSQVILSANVSIGPNNDGAIFLQSTIG